MKTLESAAQQIISAARNRVKQGYSAQEVADYVLDEVASLDGNVALRVLAAVAALAIMRANASARIDLPIGQAKQSREAS